MTLQHVLACSLAALAACGRPQLDDALQDPALLSFSNPPSASERMIMPTDIITNIFLDASEPYRGSEDKPLYFRLNDGKVEEIRFTPYRLSDTKTRLGLPVFIETLSPGSHTAEAWRPVNDEHMYYARKHFEIAAPR